MMTRPGVIAIVLAFLGCAATIVGASSPSSAAVLIGGRAWKQDVLLMEPVLVKLEITNDDDAPVQVVPPYMDCYLATNWPLTLTVTTEDGTRVTNGWPHGETGTEPVAYGRPWWVPGPSPLIPPREPWLLPARSSGHMWIDILQFYRLDKPGRYRIVLHYEPRHAMLAPLTEPDAIPDHDLTLSKADIDLGWITVGQPEGADAEAAAWLLDRATQKRVAITAFPPSITVLDWPQPVVAHHPESIHADYARFFLLLRDMVTNNAAGLKGLDAYKAEHADFPLNYRLALAEPYAAWQVAETQAKLHARRDPAAWLTQTVTDAEKALRKSIAETSDMEWRQWVETQLWKWHEKRRQALAR